MQGLVAGLASLFVLTCCMQAKIDCQIMEKKIIQVGKISGAHGLKGALNVYSFAEDESIFAKGSSVYVKHRTSGDYELFEILNSNKKKANVILVRFKEIDGRNRAEEFKGCEIYIKKDDLSQTEDDSWYWHDLIGMKVVEENGHSLGIVKDLMRTGSSDILEVDNSGKEVLIPFLKEFIVSVSLEEKFIVVNLPEGLAD